MGCAESKSNIIIQKKPGMQNLKYSGHLVPVDVGHIVTVIAKSKEDADLFNIFLSSDGDLLDDFDDIPLHMEVNFDMNLITRNSYTKEKGWGESEIEKNIAPGNNHNPIRYGEIFKIEIYIDSAMFHILIDNKPFCTFRHRMSLTKIHRINVYGDIEKIYEISHMTPKERLTKSINDESLTNIIPSAKCGSALAFYGIPQGAVDGNFEINLIDDVTQRVLCQLKIDFEERKICGKVQNLEMRWSESTELKENFPFKLNEMFKLAISITSHEFVISVDGGFSMKLDHDGEISENPLKIKIISHDGTFVDVFGINNYSKGEEVKSVHFVCVASENNAEKINPAKSFEKIYAFHSNGVYN